MLKSEEGHNIFTVSLSCLPCFDMILRVGHWKFTRAVFVKHNIFSAWFPYFIIYFIL